MSSRADHIRPNLAGDKPASLDAAPRQKGKRRLANFFGRKREPVAFTSRKPDRRGDLTVAALGIVLGLICALFPWYIFYNPEQFGVRAMKFGGNDGQTAPMTLVAQPERIGAPGLADEIPSMELDLFPTGTARADRDPAAQTPGLSEQPFPAAPAGFQLIHVENGRAMIRDDVGIFVVQRGSLLPDSSRVAVIEERAGAFVLITTENRVIGLSEQQ